MEPPIIVIGSSAGSIEALLKLLSQLPTDLKAATFIVVHTSRRGDSQLASVFQRQSRLPVSFASDRHPIKPGHVYIAPPDYHLFLEADQMRLIRGPLENNMRPAIGVLFRSAAVAHADGVTGVLLSGTLNDGVLGLSAIKRCGGKALVQSPAEALFSDLPENAIAAIAVDQVLAIAELSHYLRQHTEQPVTTQTVVPPDLLREVQMVKRMVSTPGEMSQIGRNLGPDLSRLRWPPLASQLHSHLAAPLPYRS